MSPSRSRTFPLPSKRYRVSMRHGKLLRQSNFYLRTKSTKPTRSTTGQNPPGQLELKLTTKSPSTPLRKHDQMGTFEDILNRPADEIKPPPVYPVGTYHTVLVGLPERGKSSKKQTDYFKFVHKIVA